jgi:hypothetical protein
MSSPHHHHPALGPRANRPPNSQLDPRPSFIERGSTVRIRQRALQKPRKSGLFRSDRLAPRRSCDRYGAVYGAFSFRTAAESRQIWQHKPFEPVGIPGAIAKADPDTVVVRIILEIRPRASPSESTAVQTTPLS